MGITLQILSYFTTERSKELLLGLSRQSQAFHQRYEHELFYKCTPSVSCVQALDRQEYKYRNYPVLRICHVRDDIYLIAYLCQVLELRDISKPMPVPSAEGEEVEDEGLLSFF